MLLSNNIPFQHLGGSFTRFLYQKLQLLLRIDCDNPAWCAYKTNNIRIYDCALRKSIALTKGPQIDAYKYTSSVILNFEILKKQFHKLFQLLDLYQYHKSFTRFAFLKYSMEGFIILYILSIFNNIISINNNDNLFNISGYLKY